MMLIMQCCRLDCFSSSGKPFLGPEGGICHQQPPGLRVLHLMLLLKSCSFLIFVISSKNSSKNSVSHGRRGWVLSSLFYFALKCHFSLIATENSSKKEVLFINNKRQLARKLQKLATNSTCQHINSKDFF